MLARCVEGKDVTQHRQVQLLWFGAISAVLVVGLTGVLTSRAVTQDLRPSVVRLLPASSALAQTQRSTAVLADLMLETAQAAVADRGQNYTELAPLAVARDKAWNEYKLVAADLPGEKVLQTQVETARSLFGEAGVILVTSDVISSDAMAAFVTQRNVEAQRLTQIQDLYQELINKSVVRADRDLSTSNRAVLIVAGIALTILMVGFGLRYRAVRRREVAQTDETRRNDLESGLQRALEMARTEEECYKLVGQAVQRCAPTLPSELLVADSSRAHFRQVLTTVPGGGSGCPVMTPDECPATNRGQTQRWPTSTAIDSCPSLRDRDIGPCSAVCVPVSIAGKTIGVVHATGPEEHPPRVSTTADLEVIVRKAGDRLGILRAFSRTEAQARTDPLTGLLNRRSLETSVGEVDAGAQSYVVAYGDLDHFKLLNDIHGHDAGDRALRLFARVLRDSIRPSDIAARYGGEEFVVVLPDCTLPDAYLVIDRVRAHLADAQRGGVVPSFTVSFGLAPAAADLGFGEVVELADAALLRAKADGRDRVVVAGDHDINQETISTSTAPQGA